MKEKITNKEIMDLVINMLDNAKKQIKQGEPEIRGEEGLSIISYELLPISAVYKALNRKDDTMLLKLLNKFKELNELDRKWNIKSIKAMRNNPITKFISNTMEEFDSISNKIMEV